MGRGTAIAEDEPRRGGVPTVEEPARWRQVTRAHCAGCGTQGGAPDRSGLEACWREYRHRRHGCELELAKFALYLGYDWDEVTGDRL